MGIPLLCALSPAEVGRTNKNPLRKQRQPDFIRNDFGVRPLPRRKPHRDGRRRALVSHGGANAVFGRKNANWAKTCYTVRRLYGKEAFMVAVKGYINGNTVVALDGGLRDFSGSEILIRLVDNPNAKPNPAAGNERLNALKAIQGVLKGSRQMTIAEIREERLKERYGL